MSFVVVTSSLTCSSSVKISSVDRIRDALKRATHKFFRKRNFIFVTTPTITTSDCEGAGEMFQVTTLLNEAEKIASEADIEASKELKSSKFVDKKLKTLKDGKIDYRKDFFGRQAFLTVSGQLQLESKACSLGNVYTYGPTFHAEHSHTSRHLSEFWMVEAELLPADLERDMDCAEAYVKYMCQWLLEKVLDDMQVMANNVDETCIDRLRMVGELIGESQRDERLEILEKRILERGLPLHQYEWYLDLRRFGIVEHSGFGLGNDRMILFATGLDNIRDATPFPRFPGRADL